jgi:hypothetical protein
VEVEGGARLGLTGALSLFGTAGGGARGLGFMRDTVIFLRPMAGIATGDTLLLPVPTFLPATVESRLHGMRAGAEWSGGLVRAGAAYVLHDAGTLVPYGLGFDVGVRPFPGNRVAGVEGHVSLPLVWRELRLEGWYTDWFASPERRQYLPARQGVAALEFHGLFREGNLEPTIRLEAVGRGRTTAFAPLPGRPPLEVQPYVLFNFFVQVRILDVRAFYRFDNVADWRTADIPGVILPGGRGMFGVRWFFQD